MATVHIHTSMDGLPVNFTHTNGFCAGHVFIQPCKVNYT